MSAADRADDELVQRLRRAVSSHDPVPDELLSAARGALGRRTIDTELAELVADSARTAGEGPRGAADVRSLTFRAGGQQLDVHLLTQLAGRRLTGSLMPGRWAHVVVEHEDGSLTGDADERGRFVVSALPPGRFRVRCEPVGGPAFVTPWLTG